MEKSSTFFSVEKISSELVKIIPKNIIRAPISKKWQSTASFKKERLYPLEKLDALYNFEVREEDIWIVTYPRCGTTWTQEMVWLLMNDLNFEKAKDIDLSIRSPYLE